MKYITFGCLTQPVSQAIGAFGGAVLKVEATGNPAPTYQWKFEGNDLPGQNGATLYQPQVGPTRNGAYTVVVSNAAGSVTSSPAVLSAGPQNAAGVNVHPQGQIVAAGTDVTFTAATSGTSMQWYFNDVAIPGATAANLTVRNVQLADAGAYVFEGTRAGGTTRSNPGRLTVTATSDAPALVVQPRPAMITPGTDQTLIVGAAGALPLTFEWRKNGDVIPGATSPILVLRNASNADAGSYACAVKNGLGSATTSAADLAPFNPGRIINLSILTDVTAATPLFTLGTVVGGAATAGSKPLLIRAAGPSLAALGVGGALADPKIDVFAGSSVVATNDNWSGDPALSAVMSRVGAFAFASAAARDAAVAFTPAAGPYSVQVSGVAGATGTVLAEVYDATPSGTFLPTTPRLINVSVLKPIDANAILTAGFVIAGATSRQVLIRAVVPTLGQSPFSVPAVMGDPRIDLFDAQSRVIGSNDNCGGGAALAAAFDKVGAFGLAASDSRDAALLVALAPGSYTAQVKGVGGSAGLALVEVYEVQ